MTTIETKLDPGSPAVQHPATPSAPAGGARRFRRQARWHVAASLLLGLALYLMVNYLAYRHYVRADWTRDRLNTLSAKTLTMLAGLDRTIQVTVFFQPDHELYYDVLNLLREYQSASRRIRVERVDPDRDKARMRMLAGKYREANSDVVVFDNDGRVRYVKPSDLADYDAVADEDGRPRLRKQAFKGEQAFSSAIHGVTQARLPVAYFLQGHGERDPNDPDRQFGYAEIARLIRLDNVEIRPLTLGREPAVPADADALVIAGPRLRFATAELELIRHYLEKGGRLFVLADQGAETGIEDLLSNWGVRLSSRVVVDPARKLLSLRELVVTGADYGTHPITERLHGSTCVFHLPRLVEPLPGAPGAAENADRPAVTVLASSSKMGWAEQGAEVSPRFDPKTDVPGPCAVAVAVERGRLPGVQIRPARIVVVGDSLFAANGSVAFEANPDFFLGCLNWLLERKELLAIAPKPFETCRAPLTTRQLRQIFLLTVVLLPVLAGLAGFLVNWRRRF